jgi:subtilisin family serine protease
VEAFNFALQTNAAVVSNSWSFADPMPVPQVVADAIQEVFMNGRGGKGALVLFAAGNEDREIGADEMVALPSVLAIGAINNFDDKTSFTNYGAAVELVAPVGTVTTDITGALGYDPSEYTNLFGGTSSACPVAAGIAGLLASAAPDRTSGELYDAMIRTARAAPLAVPDANGHDPVYGYGVVDPVAALSDLLGLSGEPAPAPAEEDGGCAIGGAIGERGGAAWLGAAVVAALSAYRVRRRRA